VSAQRKGMVPGARCMVVGGANSGRTCILVQHVGPWVPKHRDPAKYRPLDSWRIRPEGTFVAFRPGGRYECDREGILPTFRLIPLDDPDTPTIDSTHKENENVV